MGPTQEEHACVPTASSHGVLQVQKGPQDRGVRASILGSSFPFLVLLFSLFFSFLQRQTDNQVLQLIIKRSIPCLDSKAPTH